jgi:hypothetical protein
MATNESAEAKALTDATAALEAEVADLSALEPEIASKLAAAHDQLAHVNPVSVEQVNAVAALAHTLGGLTAELKTAVGGHAFGLDAAEAAPTPEPAPSEPAPAATGGVAEPPAAAPEASHEHESVAVPPETGVVPPPA